MPVTIRMAVEYDGSAFCGMQFQPSVRTVTGTLEAALSGIFQMPVKIASAGRTDAGVHATGQVVSFTAPRDDFPFERLALALNSGLPNDVSVREAAIAPARFSARANALERNYVFAILNRPAPSALLARYAWHVWTPLDLDRVGAAAAHVLGRHDFRSFCATPPESGVTERTVRTLSVRRSGELVRVAIGADGFLHKMVRTIVGTLVECGTGRRDPATLPAILAACERAAAGQTAPPQGLYLAGARYPDGYDSYAEPALFAEAAPSA